MAPPAARDLNSGRNGLDRRRDNLALIFLSALFAGFMILALAWGLEAFQSYFGMLHPLIAAVVILLLGVFSLTYLSRNSQLCIRRSGDTCRGIFVAAGFATALSALIVIADSILVLSADINVAWPQAFAFYPAMAYVAEIVFHAVPLAGLLALFQFIRRPGAGQRSIPWGIVVVAVLLEPVFQVLFSATEVQPVTTTIVIFLQVLAFNIVAIWLFFRFDFVTAFLFRVIYYLYWHILWGHARLEILF